MATAGMVLGIIGLALFWVAGVGGICALLGLIFGAIGIGRANKRGGVGKGKAIAGVVMGIIGLVADILLIVLAMRVASSSFEDYRERSLRLQHDHVHVESSDTK